MQGLRFELVESATVAERRLQFRTLASDAIAPHVAAGESERRLPPAVRSALSTSGCFGRSLPARYGGADGSACEYVLQQEELARVWAGAAVATTWTNLSGLILHRFGTEDHRALISGLASGATLAAVAFTEPDGGSDPTRIQTTATRVAGGWVLNGAKRLIDNVAGADFLIVLSRTSTSESRHRGLSMFLVRPEDRGFIRGGVHDLLSLRAAGVGWFSLQDCFVPEDRLVGEVDDGFRQMMQMVEFGRTSVGGICVGIATAALELARRFVQDRSTFGSPLADNDVVRAHFAQMRERLDSARLVVYQAACRLDAGLSSHAESAQAKVISSEAAISITATALQLHGGIGLSSESEILRHFRDSRAFVIGEGTSEVLRMLVGREELRQSPGRITPATDPSHARLTPVT